jgi:hypothetical protein
MRIRWRVPALLSACVVLGQILSLNPLFDLVAGASPTDVHVSYPLGHVLLAPLTLLADWLNGSPARELKGFVAWAVATYVFVRLAREGERRSRAERLRGWRLARREAGAALLGVAVLALYVAWGALAQRPIPRLATTDPGLLVFDPHSHTAASHDGRPGFDVAANAAWHARAGFDAAFVTDHNTARAARAALAQPPGAGAVLLPGIELSLNGLHLLALGTSADIPNAAYRDTWEATGRLIGMLASGIIPDSGATPADTAAPRAPAGPPVPATPPFLVASLPEYWRYHWGVDLGTLVRWGVRGFEIWTSAPRAMDFPERLRREVIARCRLDGLAMFAATDMHGLGYSATAWNVTRITGWRRLGARELSAVLVAKFRREGPDANRVIVLRRWIPETPAQAVVAVPLNLVLVLRTASSPHAAALLGWIWIVALLSGLRRGRPRS